MKSFWIDADVFMQAHNGLYAIDMALPFWKFIDEQAKVGTVRSSLRVYKEILQREDKDDLLAKWVKNRKNNGMFVDPSGDKAVQEKVTEINNYIYQQYAIKYKSYAKVNISFYQVQILGPYLMHVVLLAWQYPMNLE